ncbi:MAG: ThiF family adenylyltransferase [Oscillospiraceae bacterium]|jgi:molybdopterin/thiamine biosynthesis adenylyltransferase|nr:ThiF family adenylyltransferase [Oscillospiraceae bacterium]
MISLKQKKKNIVMLPESILKSDFTGKIFGQYIETTGVFNIYDEATQKVLGGDVVGEIISANNVQSETNVLIGVREGGNIVFTFNNQPFEIKTYNLIQNVFSRNTGILESDVMTNKSAVLLGCGSVGSFVALELAKAGVGKFLLIDNDIFEYHNICRHQCSILDVGKYKVDALAERIKAINPYADVMSVPKTVETTQREAFDKYCFGDNTIMVGGADNRAADVYSNSLAVLYGTGFISIGCWERAFAGEIFYWLPNSEMPCYKCAIGDGGSLSQKPSKNRRIYTNEEDLTKVKFVPGISADINFVTIIAVKLIFDMLNRSTPNYVPRLLNDLKQFTLVCNSNNPEVGGEMAEIFSYPLQVTTSLEVGFGLDCPPCKFSE